MHFKEYSSILSPKNGMNIYRGCTHGCVYCDSRSACYQMMHPFEDVEVKKDAYKILDIELSKKRRPVMVGTGAMSDPYNQYEKELCYTRKCLEVIFKHRCGVSILTKSNLILCDLDILEKINNISKAVVQITLTTIDDSLCNILEPNVCPTSERIKVIEECNRRGIPVVVWLCPFLPYINDSEDNVIGLVNECIRLKVKGIMYWNVGVTLREGNREYFYKFLEKFNPSLKWKYIKTFGDSYNVISSNDKAISNKVKLLCEQNNILYKMDDVFAYLNEYPTSFDQLKLL